MHFLVGLAALALIFPLGLFAIPPVMSAWRRRHEVKRFYGRLVNLDRKPELIIPPSRETAEVIVRFRRAVLHSGFSDYFRAD